MHAFSRNNHALSVMYDAVFFIVLVSLSGVILFSAFQPNSQSKTMIEGINEKRVDDIAHLLLCSTSNQCNYTVGGTIIDSTASSLGIDTSSDNGLYHSVIDRVGGHEIQHGTFGQLIIENLAAQWNCSLFNRSNEQMNWFTKEFSHVLCSEIDSFLKDQIGNRFHYQFKAYWYPIKMVPFGGYLQVGETPPQNDYFLAKKKISMPFSPAFTWGNQTIVFSEYWIHVFLSEQIESEYNEMKNISFLLNQSQKKNDLSMNETTLRLALSGNLSSLFVKIAVDGLHIGQNNCYFPGVISLLIDDFFSHMLAFTQNKWDEALQSATGQGLSHINSFLSNINSSSLIDPITNSIEIQIKEMISTVFNSSFSSINHAVTYLKEEIKSILQESINDFIQPCSNQCAQHLIESYQSIEKSSTIISSWLLDQFSFSQAIMVLIIWEKF